MDTLNQLILCKPCRLAENIRPFTLNFMGLMNYAVKKYSRAKNRIPSFLLRDDPKNYSIENYKKNFENN